jgi:hypothetical protein
LIPIIIIALLLFCLLGFIYQNTRSQKVSGGSKSASLLPTIILPKPSLTPLPTELKSNLKEQIIWMVFKDSYDNAKYSFEIPYPGPFCDACFDSSSGVRNMQGISVYGGLFKEDEDGGWLLLSTIISPKNTDPWVDYLPPKTIYESLSMTPIGGSITYNEPENEKIVVNHTQDIQVENSKILVAELVNLSHPSDPNEQIAVFKLNGDMVIISYEFYNRLYKDVFDHILSTLTFSVRSGPRYVDLCNKYTVYSKSFCNDYH